VLGQPRAGPRVRVDAVSEQGGSAGVAVRPRGGGLRGRLAGLRGRDIG
jgi:hypothetical protein